MVEDTLFIFLLGSGQGGLVGRWKMGVKGRGKGTYGEVLRGGCRTGVPVFQGLGWNRNSEIEVEGDGGKGVDYGYDGEKEEDEDVHC